MSSDYLVRELTDDEQAMYDRCTTTGMCGCPRLVIGHQSFDLEGDGSGQRWRAERAEWYRRQLAIALARLVRMSITLPAAQDGAKVEAGCYPPEPEVACTEATDDAISRLLRAAGEIDRRFAGHHENIDFVILRLRDLTKSFLEACHANDALTAENEQLRGALLDLAQATAPKGGA
ncbi:hypothetical protein EOW65_09140 [Sinirhodobacter ferrireducens]|uniref:Uncharacterized protein n=1 Tax=Paenirhodobacter ferrireducens TaxID=1215032 RepID=A0A443LJU2_9RHOB|nr:hypothetical protein [Sinirhodobacter ferrireducens]RWR49432.1 hypothetical protein EOW65_09140 [Sinirhodobacter ferrireducens]